MLKRYFASMLAAAIVAAGLFIPTASAQTIGGDQDAAKVRSDVQKLSINRDQKVEVKLKDTTKIKGNITNVSSDSFTVTESKTGRPETLSYSEVAHVKKSGGGLSTKTWLIIGGVAAGVVTTWIIVKPAVCDGGAQTRGIC